ncbi:endo alpha-1,4 polygalactosaminidase [Bradyrhizobium sp. AZCC 2176]|uniref:endo alpha-1,4 polygalactosaminidase n=1 Tax=Bradyrhizobium sp. AZCC 2176 TaxID=3117025 RepID=UPI002FEEDEF0
MSTANGQTRRGFLAATATVGLLSAAPGKLSSAEAGAIGTSGKPIRWLAFYGVTAEEAVLATYDIVVLDPAFQGSIDLVARGGAWVCGYLSLGEIRADDPSLMFLDHAALLPENPDWPGTLRVDIRHPSWRSLVLDRQIPSFASRGFSGLMFDTLDTPPYLEALDRIRFHGMREAAIELVGAIRTRWPKMMLIMNRGFALLPDVVQKIDAVIAESLMTSPDSPTGRYVWVGADQLELQLALLKPAKLRNPPLPILSLDYWDPDDTRTIAEIRHRERELGHHPYVATRSLNQIVREIR